MAHWHTWSYFWQLDSYCSKSNAVLRVCIVVKAVEKAELQYQQSRSKPWTSELPVSPSNLWWSPRTSRSFSFITSLLAFRPCPNTCREFDPQPKLFCQSNWKQNTHESCTRKNGTNASEARIRSTEQNYQDAFRVATYLWHIYLASEVLQNQGNLAGISLGSKMHSLCHEATCYRLATLMKMTTQAAIDKPYCWPWLWLIRSWANQKAEATCVMTWRMDLIWGEHCEQQQCDEVDTHIVVRE